MKFLFVIALLSLPAIAWAQEGPHQSITLSAQDYDQILSELARRDPLLSLLISKQAEAQKQTKAIAKPETHVPN